MSNDGTQGPLGPHERYREDVQRTNNDASYRIAKHDLDMSVLQVEGMRLSDIPMDKLAALHWSLTTLSGLLEVELTRRDGTSDFAGATDGG